MRALFLSCVAVLVTATTASAAFTIAQNDKVTLTDGGTGPVGGAFTATVQSAGGAAKGSFETFCVELTEHISIGSEYRVASIDSNQTSSGSLLTEQVAWLYNGFLNGTFANQDAVQYSIWRWMGHTPEAISAVVTAGNRWSAGTLAGAQAQYDDWFVNTPLWTSIGSDWKNLYGIKVLQLTTSGGGAAQDQLVQVLPSPVVTATTPEPATLAIWGGLATLGLAVRAYRRQG